MSGEVWLIFTAASRKLMAPVSLSLSAMLSLWPASLLSTARWEERALFLQGTQHSFQKRNTNTATRARPHTMTITARRLTESSEGDKDSDREGWERRKEETDGEKIVSKRKKWSKLT